MIRIGDEIWLCLYFDRLALELIGGEAGQPLAVVEAQLIHSANEAAQACGVEAGLGVATASALCPGLQLRERDPAREAAALTQLCHWAYAITPQVACGDGNTLLLEVGSCRRLHGGLIALRRRIDEALALRGHRARLSIAHTRKAAWLLSMARLPIEALPMRKATEESAAESDTLDAAALAAQLATVAIDALPLPEQQIGQLRRMGIRLLGELAALPLPALGKRFGADLVRYLQQLLGTHPDPQTPFQPLPQFAHGLHFLDGVRDRDMLLFPMKRLLQLLADYLHARQLRCRVLHWYFYDAHSLQAELTLELSRAQNRWQDLLELSRIRLERLTLPEQIFSLALHSDSFLPLAPAHRADLFATAAREPPTALLDRLAARLGRSALRQLAVLPERWPEQGWQWRAADAESARDVVEPVPIDAPRPLWLLPQPRPLRTLADGGVAIGSRPLQLLRGPERIDSPWWRQAFAARDYFLACDDDGRRCWVFRDIDSGRWYLHGLGG
jgi:protein ImuB